MWIILSILPGIIIAFLIYKSDKIEKEPPKQLVKAFMYGILSTILTLVLSFIFGVFKRDIPVTFYDVFFYSFICVALIEEFSKWILSILLVRKNKNYDYTFDAIVYFVYVGLGFATFENLLYVSTSSLLVAIIRAIATVPGHAFFAIFAGTFYTKYKKARLDNNPKAYLYLLLSLSLPILFHGIFDACLLMQTIDYLVIFGLFLIFLYIVSIYILIKMKNNDEPFIKEEKKEELMDTI